MLVKDKAEFVLHIKYDDSVSVEHFYNS